MDFPISPFKWIFPCCDKSYASKYNLKRHIETYHHNIRPFKCEICDSGFGTKQNLQEHMYIHTGEKPHQWAVCGKSFRQASQLLVHNRIHRRNEEQKIEEATLQDLLLTDLLNSQKKLENNEDSVKAEGEEHTICLPKLLEEHEKIQDPLPLPLTNLEFPGDPKP